MLNFQSTPYVGHPSVTDPVASVFSPGLRKKNVSRSANFPLGRCFAFFKYTRMIYAGYVKVVPGKPQSGRVKLQISPGTGESKFLLGEGKNPLGRVSQGLLQRGVVGWVCGSRKINYFSVNEPLPIQSTLKDFGSLRSHLKAPFSVHH